MIKAGNYTIEDKGFSVSTERIGGVNRQAIVAELPGAITEEELEALCAGPIEVLDESGAVAATHEGPFLVSSHRLRLTRASAESDVAVLSARVATLEAQVTHEQSAKVSALSELASVKQELSAVKLSISKEAEAEIQPVTPSLGTLMTDEAATSDEEVSV